jgi:hypothetical protein
VHNLGHNNPQNSILEFGTNSLLVNLDSLFEFDFALEDSDFSAFVGDETVHDCLGDVGAGYDAGNGDAVARARVGYVEFGLFGAGQGGVDDVASGGTEEVDGGSEGAVVGGLGDFVGGLVVGEGVVAAEEGGCKGFG